MIVLPLIDSSKKSIWNKIGFNNSSKKLQVGSVKFHKEGISITLNRNTIHYYSDQIKSIELKGCLHKGFNPYKSPYAMENYKLVLNGFTSITIVLEKNKIHLEFLLANKKNFNAFIKVLKYWYVNKSFPIKEYDKEGNRALLLNPFLTYESIQILKKELNIESMYN